MTYIIPDHVIDRGRYDRCGMFALLRISRHLFFGRSGDAMIMGRFRAKRDERSMRNEE